MKFFWPLVAYLLADRLAELVLAGRNEAVLKKMGGLEFDAGGYRVIVITHVLFLVSFILEEMILKRPASREWIILTALFVTAQIVRFWSMASLGVRWSTKIISVPNLPHVRKGPYRFFRHPNYLAVLLETVVVPLLFSCYVTLVVFVPVISFLTLRRMKIENLALRRETTQ